MSGDELDTIFVEDETLRRGFTQIPNAILSRPDLTPGAKLTYVGLLSYSWQSGSCFPGQERLAHDLGISSRSAWTYLRQLQESGLISIRRRGLGKTNIYVIHRFANIADQESQTLANQEPQIVRRKNTQNEEEPMKKIQEDTRASRAAASGVPSPTPPMPLSETEGFRRAREQSDRNRADLKSSRLKASVR